jgi:hypothetical protein
MATMMKSLLQNWLNWDSVSDRKDTEVPQCGLLDNKVEGSDDSNIEDGEKVSERRNSASPWVHGLL